MTDDTTRATVPRWPCYRLTAADDGTVTADGPGIEAGPYTGQNQAAAAVAALAAQLTRPVRAEASDPDGTVWPLIIEPSGTVTADGPARRDTSRRRKATARRPQAPAGPAPVPAPRNEPEPPPARAAEPTQSPRPPAPAEPARPAPQPAPSFLRIRPLEQAGDLDGAADLAAELDDATARTHGPSHPEAVRAREIRAYLNVQRGDLTAAAHLYRDVAERQFHQGDHPAAAESASRAHALWLQVTDVTVAVGLGTAIIRMRSLIPGQDNTAYHKAVRHQARLEAAHAGSEPLPGD
ncbi:hypothetical protein [Streptomyces sp. NPDC018045]|uniref:hypothetical protein n=1 Tax=Streptomyces sp. NPDC018045 TaxID=3365037 RepID=UPI00379D1E9A